MKQRFDADEEIAFAWKKAQEGPLTEEQGKWFRQLAVHEIAEKEYMDKGIPYLRPESWDAINLYFKVEPRGAHGMAPKPPTTIFPGYEPEL